MDGTVTDSLKNPLHGANIIAIPASDELEMRFSISDDIGRYRLNLAKDSTYILEVSYMGFQKIIDTISYSKDITQIFRMKPSSESLDEVLINHRMAVVVKKDTIIYRTDVFKTGKERKLLGVLKKLPGIEVKRDGTVTVNGKRVDKLMVDGKTFFTGDTKLAIENIPADAVDEVEVLDNYSEVPFLKGLEDSDKMVMNIKLAKGKKKFVFGEIEAGGGIKDRFILHPTLFYYSPRTSINLIGDLNNIGEKAFSVRDYVNFEGGILALMDKSGGFRIYNDDFSRFLRNKDFIYSKNQFGAFNIVQKINNKLHLNAYTIASSNKMEMLEENFINYVNGGAASNEYREIHTNNDLFFSLNKLQLRYIPHREEDFTYDVFLKISNANAVKQITSETPVNTNFINTLNKPTTIDFTQNLKYSKKFSYKQTSTINLNYKFSKNDNHLNWLFDQPLFSGVIPFIEEDNSYELLQNTGSTLNRVNLEFKHYWVLNNTNHIYPIMGTEFLKQQFNTLDAQVLNNGEKKNFRNAGFNNDLDFSLVDSYAGFQYKMKLGKLIMKPGLVYHFYLWNASQFKSRITNNRKPVLLPEFHAEYELRNSEKIRFTYSLNSRFSDVRDFANRLRLTSFNRLFIGNEELENEHFHTASLDYYNFNLLKGIFINGKLIYNKRLRSVSNTSIMQGIDQITTAIYTDLPEENYSFSGSFSKKIHNYKFTILGNGSYSNYQRVINNDIISYKNKKYGYTFKTETSFHDLPDLEIGVQQRFSELESDNFYNSIESLNPYAILEYDFLSDFVLKADYAYNYYKNLNWNNINRFQMGNASLFYSRENNPWGFEIDIKNVFDTRLKRSNSFNQFIIEDQQIFIQPRTILFKVTYKL